MLHGKIWKDETTLSNATALKHTLGAFGDSFLYFKQLKRVFPTEDLDKKTSQHSIERFVTCMFLYFLFIYLFLQLK